MPHPPRSSVQLVTAHNSENYRHIEMTVNVLFNWVRGGYLLGPWKANVRQIYTMLFLYVITETFVHITNTTFFFSRLKIKLHRL